MTIIATKFEDSNINAKICAESIKISFESFYLFSSHMQRGCKNRSSLSMRFFSSSWPTLISNVSSCKNSSYLLLKETFLNSLKTKFGLVQTQYW